MIIRYTIHGIESIEECVTLGFDVTRTLVELVLAQPDLIDAVSRYPQIIAQKRFDDAHVLRVVYRKEFNYVLVITVYIGRRKQYER
jgi:hypothetical protein